MEKVISKIVIREHQQSDLEEIKQLMNEQILKTDNIYDIREKTSLEISEWMKAKEQKSYPILIVEYQGEFAGFASYDDFRTKAAYQTSAESTIYLRSNYRGKGIGGLLMDRLEELARKQKKQLLVAGIDSQNLSGIEFHRGKGFEKVGEMPKIARKNGKWLNLILMQKVI